MNAPLDPGNVNRYLYAAGDPLDAQDPSGHDEDACTALEVGGLITGATPLGAITDPFTAYITLVDVFDNEDCQIGPGDERKQELNDAPDFGQYVSP